MFGAHPGVNVGDLDDLLHFLRSAGFNIGAGKHLMPGLEQADVFGDGFGGVGEVARNHHRADAGTLGFLEGGFHFRPAGVDHTDQAGENQVFLQVFRGDLGGFIRHGAVGHAQHAQGLFGHIIVGVQNGLPQLGGEFGDRVIHFLEAITQFEHQVRGAFNVHHVLVGFFIGIEGADVPAAGFDDLVHGDHALTLAIKGDLLRAGVVGVQFLGGSAGLMRGHQDGTLGGVADHTVGLAAFAFAGELQLGIVIQRADPKRVARALVLGEVDDLSVNRELAHRFVSGAGDLNELIVHPEVGDGHLVLGEGAGFIGADGGN